MQVAILDEAGGRLGERRVGEVACAGDAVSPGYWGDDEATRTVFHDGWVHTGDLGYLSGGQLYLVGRKKDVLIVHGQKYAPQAVEWAAEEVEGVRRGRSAAFAVPNADTGTEDVVIACESTLPPDQHADLVRTIAARILEQTGLKVAAHIFPAGIAPKTSSGKIMRGAAREMFLQWRAGAR
jgi:fatty-acyl-CoA synthase